jgi:hypothetical protein
MYSFIKELNQLYNILISEYKNASKVKGLVDFDLNPVSHETLHVNGDDMMISDHTRVETLNRFNRIMTDDKYDNSNSLNQKRFYMFHFMKKSKKML